MSGEYFINGYVDEPEPPESESECTCSPAICHTNDFCPSCKIDFEEWCISLYNQGIIGGEEIANEPPVPLRRAA